MILKSYHSWCLFAVGPLLFFVLSLSSHLFCPPSTLPILSPLSWVTGMYHHHHIISFADFLLSNIAYHSHLSWVLSPNFKLLWTQLPQILPTLLTFCSCSVNLSIGEWQRGLASSICLSPRLWTTWYVH